MKHIILLLTLPFLASCEGTSGAIADALAARTNVAIKGEAWTLGYAAGQFGFVYDLTKRVKSGKEPVKAAK